MHPLSLSFSPFFRPPKTFPQTPPPAANSIPPRKSRITKARCPASSQRSPSHCSRPLLCTWIFPAGFEAQRQLFSPFLAPKLTRTLNKHIFFPELADTS